MECPCCYRVRFADGSSLLVDAMSPSDARREAKRLATEQRGETRIAEVENLDQKRKPISDDGWPTSEGPTDEFGEGY